MTAGEAKVSPSGGDLEGAESSGFLNLMTLGYASSLSTKNIFWCFLLISYNP